MKIILIIATILLMATLSINAQYLKTTLYTDKACATTPAYLSIYLPDATCTSGNVSTCIAHPTLTTYNFNTACSSSVPSVGPSKTLMLSVYSDNTCATSNLIVSQVFPLDTCVSIPGSGSYKSAGCKTLTIYSDSACQTVKQSVDYSAYNGVCNSGTKYVCSSVAKMGMSMIVMMATVLLAIVF